MEPSERSRPSKSLQQGLLVLNLLLRSQNGAASQPGTADTEETLFISAVVFTFRPSATTGGPASDTDLIYSYSPTP